MTQPPTDAATPTRLVRLAAKENIDGPRRVQIGNALRVHYEAGASLRDLAAATGRSYGWVHRMLLESGARIRSHGGPRTPKPPHQHTP